MFDTSAVLAGLLAGIGVGCLLLAVASWGISRTLRRVLRTRTVAWQAGWTYGYRFGREIDATWSLTADELANRLRWDEYRYVLAGHDLSQVTAAILKNEESRKRAATPTNPQEPADHALENPS